MLCLWPRIYKTFSQLTFLGLNTLGKLEITLEQNFLTVGQNNYGNKIPLSDKIYSLGKLVFWVSFINQDLKVCKIAQFFWFSFSRERKI